MKTGIDKTELKQWLERHNWIADNYGNYRKSENGKVYRMKLQDNSLRYEVQITLTGYNNKPVHEWLRIKSGYYKNLSINADGKIAGLKS
jgi:hypothetical protein